MASCDTELSNLPLLTGCPGANEYVLVGNASGGQGVGLYGRRSWSNIISCIIAGIKFMFKDFIVGQSGDLLGIGGTTITLTFSSLGITSILQDSVFITLVGSELPRGDNTQISYSVIYNPTNVVITFNQGGQSGQQYILHYAYM